MRKRTALVVLVLLALAIPAVVLLAPGSRDADVAPTPADSGPGDAAPARRRADTGADSSRPVAETTPEIAPRRARGAVELPDGTPPESGLLVFLRWDEPPSLVLAPLANGRFDVELPEDGTWSVSPLMIDGSSWNRWSWPREIEAGVETTLLLRFIEFRADIRAVGARSALVIGGDLRSHDVPHPERLEYLVPKPGPAREAQTVEVAADGEVCIDGIDVERDECVWMRAARGRWVSVEQPNYDDVALPTSPAATLSLDVGGWTQLDRPEIVLRYDDGTEGLLPRRPDERGSLAVEGLRTGACEIVIRRRPWERVGVRYGGEVYARTRAELVAGETTRLRLAVDCGEVPTPERVSGTLVIPAAWGLDEVDVRVYGMDSNTIDVEARGSSVKLLHTDDQATSSGPFGFRPLPRGRYELLVRQLGWTTRLDVPNEQSRFVAPAPAEVRVRVADAVTGDELPNASGWFTRSVSPTDVPRWQQEQYANPRFWVMGDGWTWTNGRTPSPPARRIPGTGVLTAKVPPGDVTIHATAQGRGREEWGFREVVVTGLSAGEVREVTVRLAPAGHLHVGTLLEGEDFDFYPLRIRLESMDGDEVRMHASRTSLLSHGRWRVEVAPVFGHDVIAPESVEIVAGETTTLRIELRPVAK